MERFTIVGALTKIFDGLIGPPPSVTAGSLIDRKRIESERGIGPIVAYSPRFEPAW
jgi:hypothetical protein